MKKKKAMRRRQKNIDAARLRWLRPELWMHPEDLADARKREAEREAEYKRTAEAWQREADAARQAGRKAFLDYYPWEAPEDIGPGRFHAGLGTRRDLTGEQKFRLRGVFIEGMGETQKMLRALPSNPWQQAWFRQRWLCDNDLPWWEQPWLLPETVTQLCALVGGAVEVDVRPGEERHR